MSEKQNSNKEEDVESFDLQTLEKFESEMAHIFEELKKDSNLGHAIDQIFEESNNLNEIQTKTILLIQKHAKAIGPTLDPKLEKSRFDPKQMAKDMSKLIHDLMKNNEEEINDPEIGTIAKGDKYHHISGQSKKDLKRIMKNFAVYQVYKVMTPKRIAGETKKDNYEHNMMKGGEKLARQYEGGSDADIKSYGKAEVERIKKQSNQFQKGGGIIRM